jgi:hypothetical protein
MRSAISNSVSRFWHACPPGQTVVPTAVIVTWPTEPAFQIARAPSDGGAGVAWGSIRFGGMAWMLSHSMSELISVSSTNWPTARCCVLPLLATVSMTSDPAAPAGLVVAVACPVAELWVVVAVGAAPGTSVDPTVGEGVAAIVVGVDAVVEVEVPVDFEELEHPATIPATKAIASSELLIRTP